MGATADWHVGKPLARRQRLDEAGAALKEVVAIAQDEKVDAVLVCGDIYEHLTPSFVADRLAHFHVCLANKKEQGVPKHIDHSIICIGALIAHRGPDHWAVDAVGAPHVGERTEKQLITACRVQSAAHHLQRQQSRSPRDPR